MIFSNGLAEKVMAGEKTVTRRPMSKNERSPWWEGGCKYDAGQRFAVNPGRGIVRLGDAVMQSVTLEPLGRLSQAEAEAEGFDSPEAFEERWAEIWGSYDPEQLAWTLRFEVVR